ncbi:MAG: alpha-E domain-containing protein, partial [Chloroflexi bacterium]|nr:alpha-E domain-containing protein [Chloroflexota bacterium]
MLLSRTADSLFWMARYIERAESIARLLDVGRRMA